MKSSYKSGLERTVAANLSMRKIKFTYEELKLPYNLPERNYYPDILLKETGIIVEIKGYLRTEDRAKMVAVKRCHPSLDIRFLFQDASKKVPGLKMTHGEWATKNGFVYCEGEVPEEWLQSS